jgi:hypothetical protein
VVESIILLLHTVHAISGAHPGSYPAGIRGLFAMGESGQGMRLTTNLSYSAGTRGALCHGVKWPGHETNHQPLTSAEVKKTYIPHTSSWHGA